MNAEKFLRTKGIGEPTIKAVRLPHKYKNIEFELLPLMEEYAQQQIVSAEKRSEQSCQYEPDDTTAMNCKHCGNPKWTHDCCKLA